MMELGGLILYERRVYDWWSGFVQLYVGNQWVGYDLNAKLS